MAGAKYAKTQVPTTASAPNHGLSAHPICQEVGVEHTTQRSGSDSAPGACESKRIEDFLRLLSLLPLRKCLAASGSRWAAATAVSAVVTRSYCASVEWSPSAVSQGGSCISGGLLFNRWRVPTSLGAAWPDPKNAMPQPPNNAVATRNKWRVTKGKAMPAVTIVDRAITPAVEKTAVDEGLEARKSPQRGRQTPQRPNDAKAHSIARRGGADLTSQTRAKSARRPNGKAHVGTSWHPT